MRMSLTQKKVKEQIKLAETMIENTVEAKNEALEVIKKYRDDSNQIDIKQDENIINAVDELNGLMNTITYYNGQLEAFNWVLDEMRAKSNKKKEEE